MARISYNDKTAEDQFNENDVKQRNLNPDDGAKAPLRTSVAAESDWTVAPRGDDSDLYAGRKRR